MPETEIDELKARQDRFEREVREEIRDIRDTLAQAAVSQATNETILSSLVEEVKAFRTEYFGLLTESLKTLQKQSTTWTDTATKVVLGLLAIAGGVFGVTQMIK